MRKVCFLVMAVLLVSGYSIAQNAKYHSDIVYRVSEHISWSRYNNDYKFVIGVVGNAADFDSFRSYAVTHHSIWHDNPVEVRYFECTDDLRDCDLIYVSEDCSIEISKIVEETRDESILIVSGKSGYAKAGSIINFVDLGDKLKFELNLNEAQHRGLLISDSLKNLAILI